MHGEEWVFRPVQQDIGLKVTTISASFRFSIYLGILSLLLRNSIAGFDGCLVLKWLLDNGANPKIIMNGGRIMAMDVKKRYGLEVRDSLIYNPQT